MLDDDSRGCRSKSFDAHFCRNFLRNVFRKLRLLQLQTDQGLVVLAIVVELDNVTVVAQQFELLVILLDQVHQGLRHLRVNIL